MYLMTIEEINQRIQEVKELRAETLDSLEKSVMVWPEAWCLLLLLKRYVHAPSTKQEEIVKVQ